MIWSHPTFRWQLQLLIFCDSQNGGCFDLSCNYLKDSKYVMFQIYRLKIPKITLLLWRFTVKVDPALFRITILLKNHHPMGNCFSKPDTAGILTNDNWKNNLIKGMPVFLLGVRATSEIQGAMYQVASLFSLLTRWLFGHKKAAF